MKKKPFFILFVFVAVLFVAVSFNLKKLSFVSNFISYNTIILIKKYVFPYRYIKETENKLNIIKKDSERKEEELLKSLLDADQNLKKYLHPIKFYRQAEDKYLGYENLFLSKYLNINDLVYGINLTRYGSGYLEFYNDNIFIVSSTGVIAYGKIENKSISLDQIKNNLEIFLPYKNRKIFNGISIKDTLIINDKIYVSLLEEIKKGCWTNTILVSELDFNELMFERKFSPKECVDKYNSWNNEFSWHQTGGRLERMNDNEIFFSTGEFRNRELAQDNKSIFGKILKINLDTEEYKIISKGHRNPQGLYFDAKENIILSSDHGATGGDEINLSDLNLDREFNFGWPIASYSKHYSGGITLERFPLLKSHKENGFDEPIKYFKADENGKTIGPSQIIKYKENKYILSSMYKKSIFLFELNKSRKIKDIKKIKVGERIRDLIIKDNKIYLFLENTASIGVIDLISIL